MNKKVIATPYDAITYKVIGCAMAVHRALGAGLREDSYQRALTHQLQQADLRWEQQKRYEVVDADGNFLGYYIPDFLVEEAIIVEIKAIRGFDNSHLAQVIGYLAVSGCGLGLLINFGERSLAYRRILPPNKISSSLINRQWLFPPDSLEHKTKP